MPATGRDGRAGSGSAAHGLARLVGAAVPLALLLVVVAADAALPAVHGTVPVAAVVDETGHTATGLLVLLALAATGRSVTRSRPFCAGVLLGSVLIDVDHVPSTIAHWNGLTTGTPRPYTHSLATIAALAVAAAAARRRSPSASLLAAGLALGVAFHLLRDAAVPAHVGVSVLWPLSPAPAQISQWAYLGVLAAAAVVAAVGTIPRHGMPAAARGRSDRGATSASI